MRRGDRRDHDKMKDDAIAQLSDQLIASITRLDSIERRQQKKIPGFNIVSRCEVCKSLIRMENSYPSSFESFLEVSPSYEHTTTSYLSFQRYLQSHRQIKRLATVLVNWNQSQLFPMT